MHLPDIMHSLRQQAMEKNSSALKNATILHNPGAGEGDSSKRELLRVLELAGFKCSYSSTKQFRWENIDTDNTDFLVLAGGDGTVRKVAEEMLSRKLIEKKLPLGLLPMGTANNIARTLGLCADPGRIVEGWSKGEMKKFDVGVIKGLDKPQFFLESFGFGVFPRLMQEMKKQNKNDIDDAGERLRAALQILTELISDAPVRKCRLEVDGHDYSGDYLLVEVMNTRSIGPNLALAPEGDPGDGVFEVVVIREEQRDALIEYVNRKIDGSEVTFDLPIYTVRKRLVILWDGKHMHIDDEFGKIDKAERIDIEVRPGLLDFLIPAPTVG